MNTSSTSLNDLTTTGATQGAKGRSSALGAAAQPSTIVNFEMPSGACDCLTHIFGDAALFPMAPGRTYTPEPALVPEMRALHRAIHVDRVIIVHPTVYGTNNACTLDAIKQLGPNARGIAVIDANTQASELDDMDRAGIRGIRINLETVGLTDPAIARQRFLAAIEQVRGRTGWHIQIYTRPSIIEAIYDLLVDSPVPLAFDHFGGTKTTIGMQETGFSLLLDLLRAGKAYVKLSAPYLVSKQGPDYPDVVPLAKALIAANRERILWGTNWPHPYAVHGEGRKATEVTPLRQMDDGEILNLLPLWAPDAEDRKLMLADNPARLYGF
jgi:predicted TIM-barrel fold metal-dependent hydrolase